MATTNTGSFTAAIQEIHLNPDGSMSVMVQYTNTTTGRLVTMRYLKVPADPTVAITDQFGQAVAPGSAWGTLATAISTFMTQLQSSFSGAAAGGKLDI